MTSPIRGFVGPNGSGKSLAMISETVPVLRSGRPVVSTVPILDPATRRPHDLYTPLTSLAQLLELEHCHVLMDEVTGIASSRSSASMPDVVANWLVQLRRRDVVLFWTSPDWRRADIIIREVSQVVTYCRGMLPERTDGDRLWRPNRFFVWSTYDALAFEDFTAGARTRLKPLSRRFYWRPRHDDQHWYDTLQGVHQLDHVTEGGSCVYCGGRRARPKCECPPARVCVEPARAPEPEVAQPLRRGSYRSSRSWSVGLPSEQ